MTWKLSLSTSIGISRPVTSVLPLICEAGFRRVQVSTARGHFDYGESEQVLALREGMKRLGLRCTSMHAPFGGIYDLTSTREDLRMAAVKEVERAADALAALGGRTLVVHAGTEDEEALGNSRERLANAVLSLESIHSHCRQAGVQLVIEDMLAHLLGGRTDDVLWVLSQLSDRDIGICLDAGHSFLAGDLLGRAGKFGNRIMMVHAHDNRGHRDDHLPPGEGIIPWPVLMGSLAVTGFSGEFVLEINEVPGDRELVSRVRRSSLFLAQLAAAQGFSLSY